MVSIQAIPPSDTSWQALAPPSLVAQIATRFVEATAPPIILVTKLLGSVVGCGLCLPEADGTGEILLLTVVPAMRRRGVGTALLKAIEALASPVGVRTLTAGWTDRKDDAGIAGLFFEKCGWRPAEPSGLAVTMEAGKAASYLTGLASRHPPCPYQFIPWSAVRADQHAALRPRLAEMPSLPSGLTPDRIAPQADPDLSIAMVSGDDRVVGWHFGNWPAPNRTWVLASYGLPEALGGACFIRLWITYFKRISEHSPDICCGWDTHVSLDRMMRFLIRREGPAGYSTKGRWSSSRLVAP